MNAIIRGKLGIDPTEIIDVEDWIEAYSQADYLFKVENLSQFSAVRKAVTEVVEEIFKKKDE